MIDGLASETARVPMRLVEPDGAMVVELDRPEMTLGRHSNADIRLPLLDVSRHHCRFTYQEGDWHIWDLNSLNGTFLNGERVDHAVLQSRDQLVIGGMQFEVRMPGDGPAATNVLRSIARQLPERVAS